MKKKYEALSYVWSALSTTEVALTKAWRELESFYKRVEDLELSLNETREGWKTVRYILQEMHHENLRLSKKYVKYVEDNFSILLVSFEITLQ